MSDKISAEYNMYCTNLNFDRLCFNRRPIKLMQNLALILRKRTIFHKFELRPRIQYYNKYIQQKLSYFFKNYNIKCTIGTIVHTVGFGLESFISKRRFGCYKRETFSEG